MVGMADSKQGRSLVTPAEEFGDLAAAFANPAKVAQVLAAPDVVPSRDGARRPRGRPRSEAELVNQTLSIRADQLQELHRISAAEYARLGRRVLPSEVVRALLDHALAGMPAGGGLLE